MIDGKRMLTIDIHAHCQVDEVWPLIEGRPELNGRNPYESNPLAWTPLEKRIADMDATGIDMQALSLNVSQSYYWAERELAEQITRFAGSGTANQSDNFTTPDVEIEIIQNEMITEAGGQAYNANDVVVVGHC